MLGVILLALGLGCGAPTTGPAEAEAPAEALLPASVGDWIADGETQELVGEELFMYMNGGAEIYHEYGFSKLFVREYARAEDRISVEQYLMSGPAFGIYTYARSSSGEAIDIGDQGTLADYYLTFWSDQSLLVVTAQTEIEEARAAVLELATGLAELASAGGAAPTMMSGLATEGLVSGSEIYLVGAIALNNLEPTAARLFSGFEEGASAVYQASDEPAHRVILLRWPDAAAADEAMRNAATELASDSELEILPATEGQLSIALSKGEQMVVQHDASLLRLTITKARG